MTNNYNTMDADKVRKAFTWLARKDFHLFECFSHNLKEIRDQAVFQGYDGNYNKRIVYACQQAYELDKLYFAEFGEHFGRTFNKTNRSDMTNYLGEINQILSWNIEPIKEQ